MSEKTINKKTPFTKKEPTVHNPNELYQSALELDEALIAELKEKGLVHRWINYTAYARSYGFNRAGWHPYKRVSKPVFNGSESVFTDPEGLTRRGDLILAVKSKESQAKHAAALKQKADLYRGFAQQKAKEMKELAYKHGVKSKVIEGYEDAGETDDGDED